MGLGDLAITYADVRAATHESLESVHTAMRELSHSIADLRAAIEGVKHDTSQINETGSHTLNASLRRIEANLHQVQNMATTLNHLVQSHSDMHSRLQNIEQLTGDMGSYLTNLHNQVTGITNHLGVIDEQREAE